MTARVMFTESNTCNLTAIHEQLRKVKFRRLLQRKRNAIYQIK